LRNSENGDIAWCNANNTEWGFYVFLNNKNLFLFKTPKKRVKKQKAQVGCFFKKNGFSQH